MADTSAEALVAAHMAMLRTRYLEAMVAQMETLSDNLTACERRTLDDEGRAGLRHIAHKLAGTGKTYGFPDLSIVARRLDDLMINDPAAPMNELAVLARDVLAQCTAAQGGVEPPPAPEPDVRPQALARTESAPAPRGAFGRRNTEAAPPVIARTVAPPAPSHSLKRRPLILVADDDEAVRNLFGSLFAEDARVVFATNSDEALVMMRRFPPDVVLLDDIMPGAITGLKLLENLKASRDLNHIPVVMITASDGEEHVERGLNAGAAGYITKPFDAVAVVNWVRNLLAREMS